MESKTQQAVKERPEPKTVKPSAKKEKSPPASPKVEELERENNGLRSELDSLRSEFSGLRERFKDFERRSETSDEALKTIEEFRRRRRRQAGEGTKKNKFIVTHDKIAGDWSMDWWTDAETEAQVLSELKFKSTSPGKNPIHASKDESYVPDSKK